MIKLSLEDVRQLATETLIGAGASSQNASAVADSTVLAERDGIRSHGLLYVPIYAEHVKCGKVDGTAVPVVEKVKSGSIRVDAKTGFAHPAIDAGFDAFIAATKENGVAALTTRNSYNCGVLGHHAERIAEQGLVGLCFTHAPASIAPTGGKTPVIGTNPFALAVPDTDNGAALVIDQSASTIAKSEILLRASKDETIEDNWALDSEGNPTTDAKAALKGSMLPSGGQKGFGVGLLVEIMASCLAGALLSRDAAPFSGTVGGPPKTGQCFLAFDTSAFSGELFVERISALTQAIEEQAGARLPGSRRKNNRQAIEKDGVIVDPTLLERIKKSG
ncbi:Ldh family oxidoreductase [Candidatus Persebacteraceae bacterium Df01]|jgi:(2R)-3-sulfolactate dehydrogenase (NADP+)|uniref:Ldh family oxidoreductase n=1 Tax=Candidatus Doriopsillibacter californiensis TaxID=2970740 RepID=A0ABT7QL97_9GAMM|nr:Ldh family oxidoreductase [Candidatus Persebacteraceae bacterium Df01]